MKAALLWLALGLLAGALCYSVWNDTINAESAGQEAVTAEHEVDSIWAGRYWLRHFAERAIWFGSAFLLSMGLVVFLYSAGLKYTKGVIDDIAEIANRIGTKGERNGDSLGISIFGSAMLLGVLYLFHIVLTHIK